MRKRAAFAKATRQNDISNFSQRSPHNQRKSQLDDVKNSIRPVDFYQVELPNMPPPRGGGWRDGGLCQFHNDRQAGSFRVNLDTGAFVCFACGTRGGDIVSFIQQRDGLSFHRAVKKIAHEWGL